MSQPPSPAAEPVRDLADIQAAHARTRRLEKLARRDPAIEELYTDFQAVSQALASAKTAREIAETALAEVRAELSAANTDKARLAEELAAAKTQLAAALKPKRAS